MNSKMEASAIHMNIVHALVTPLVDLSVMRMDVVNSPWCPAAYCRAAEVILLLARPHSGVSTPGH